MIASWRRSVNRKRVIGVVYSCSALIITVGLSAGCGNKDGGPNRLSPQSKCYIEGVPLPAGFNLSDKMTEDYESGQQRTARHEYRGFANSLAVRDFYRDQMPTQGWNCVSDQNVKGIVTMRFERKGEACTIQIKPGWLNYTRVQVILNPFNRTGNEPPKRPTS
jgi:hypothetical protein